MSTVDYSKYLAALAELLHKLDLSARSDNDDKQVFVDTATAAIQKALADMPPIIFITITPAP